MNKGRAHMWRFRRNNSKYQFWQQHNQPVELTIDAFAIDRSINYIHNNPVESGFVYRPEEYPFSSAIDFAGEKGMVDVEPC